MFFIKLSDPVIFASSLEMKYFIIKRKKWIFLVFNLDRRKRAKQFHAYKYEYVEYMNVIDLHTCM